MPAPRLNMDLGELPDEPEELWTLAELANVACGGHAGDASSLAHACELARRHGVQLGAHPSYEDRENFGRISLPLSPAALEDSVRRQCRRLVDAAAQAGVSVLHVKPHGALYHDASRDPALARAVIAGARAAIGKPAIVGPPDSQLLLVAQEEGLLTFVEGFADRGYLPDGSLVPRTQSGALLTEPAQAAAQARRLADTGRFQTLCIHSDTAGAIAIAQAVRVELTHSVKLQPVGDTAWRVELPKLVNRAEALRLLRSLPNVLDAVVTDHHAMLRFNPTNPPPDPRPLLEQARDVVCIEPARHVIRVAYDGPDLGEVASLCGVTASEVIARHAAREYTVELVGFLPGFAYLGALDEVLARVPRRVSPRPRVSASSVAIASGRTAVYPFSSPGGWQLLGTAMNFKSFDQIDGSALRLGDRVRFEPA